MSKRLNKEIMENISDGRIDGNKLVEILRKHNRRREFKRIMDDIEVINIDSENSQYMVVELLRFISKSGILNFKFWR